MFADQCQQPDAFLVSQQRQEQRAINAVGFAETLLPVGKLDDGPIGIIERLLFQDRTRWKIGRRIDRRRIAKLVKRTVERRCGYRHVPCPLATHDESAVALQQPDGGRHDGVEDRLHVGRRPADDAQDVGGGGLPGQRLLGFVEQPRILDRDHRLVSESLLQRQLSVGEWREPLAVDDQDSNRLVFVSKRRGRYRARAFGSRCHHGPMRHAGIDMIEVGNMDLPIFPEHRSREVVAAKAGSLDGYPGPDPLRTGAVVDRLAPTFALHQHHRHAGGAEQTCRGFGDLLQRLIGIARGVGDGTQDFGARALALEGRPQFALQPEIVHRARGLPVDRRLALDDSGFELPLKLGNSPSEIGCRVLGKRRHDRKNPAARARSGHVPLGNPLSHPGRLRSSGWKAILRLC